MNRLRLIVLLPIALLLASSLLYCKYAQKTPETQVTATSTMPKPPAAHLGDYADEWKIIDSLEDEGLLKSALERTEALYTRTKKEKNGPQTIKTLLYRGKYTVQLEEDGFVKAVETFEQEVKVAKGPERAVLQSLLGELYGTYVMGQGWRIQDRTPIPEGEGGDILTWSAEQLEQQALHYFQSSIENVTALHAVPVDYINDISQAGYLDSVGAEALRPTLFDLLAHRALAHFSNERSFMTEPAYKFYLDQSEAFAPAANFIKFDFESRDTTSGKWLAIRLFQRILAVHLSDEKEAALIDIDLMRLKFAKTNAVQEDRVDQYQQALAVLHKTHINHPSDAEIVFEMAQALVEENYRVRATDSSLLKQAVAACEDAIRRHPDSYGAKQCAALLHDLSRPALDLDVELVNLPNKPTLFSLSFQNLSTVFVKVVSVPNDPDLFRQIEWEKHLEYLNGQPVVQAQTWQLTNPGDYQKHRTELKLDALPLGKYFVLAASSKEFSDKDQLVSFAAFTCSSLAAVGYQEDGGQHFAIVNRSTGTAIADVQADCFETRWNRDNRQNIRELIKQVNSNRQGLLKPNVNRKRGYSIRLNHDKDTLWLNQTYRDYRQPKRVRKPEVQFFTDRALYRPGQTVYFKGIMLQRNKEGYPEILPNTTATVKFYDVNNQEKNSLTLRTNEYGTFNGTFQAPATGLTGRMSIRVEEASGSAGFNVEEYKRPKFEVTFQPVKGAYRVNDSVTVEGLAKNYAGSSVDGATVRYRVVRRARFPWWDNWSWRRPSPSRQMEIANGLTSTGPDGSFEIQFLALPDRKIPKKDQPMFDYTVMADVIDITGETRSNETSVSAGYIALQVDLDLPLEIELDSLRAVSLNTTNSAGQFQAATGIIDIQGLVEPKPLFIKRYWDDPDILTLKEGKFKRDFPGYAWDGENRPEKWDRQDFVRPVNFNTADAQKVDLHGGNMTTGYYQITLTTKDPFGAEIEIKKTIRVWDASDRRTQFVEPDCVSEKQRYEPGETARIWLGGKADRLSFLLIQEREGKQLAPRWLDVSGAKSVDISIQEKDRGGMSVSAFTVKDNRYYSINKRSFQVPWSNKDLTISYETFRDKLAPGDQEEWRLKISGPKKEQVAAEMVTAMYDASLDQFLGHNWSGIRFPSHPSLTRFASGEFKRQNGDNRYQPVSGIPQPGRRHFRRLDWFSFPLYGGRFLSGQRSGAVEEMVVTFSPETYEETVTMARNDAPAAKAAGMMSDGDQSNLPTSYSGEEANEDRSAPPSSEDAPPPPLRRNLQETVFFFPELHTDAAGNVIVKFTMNEALTRWKVLAFAHTKELQWALSEKSVVTQKELMILTNPPRFLREGDEIEFSAKVSNLSEAPISGTAYLNLFDAASMQPVEPALGLTSANKTLNFTVQPGQSTPVSWRLKIPEGELSGLTWQVFADGGTFKDGEENTLPVLTNRMLVTETLPITVRGNQSKTVVFENFKNSKSSTLRTHRYTLEFSSNPAWYAVQALPYLMEFPHECNEQMFSRFYANTLASSVTKKLPNLRRVYDRWKGTEAMKSNLSKNQELKTALLEETPWVLDAQSEEQQRQNIALLFDLNRMADEQERVLNKLKERQGPGGGWSWFPGGRESWYITQHIVTGFGHLDKLGAYSPKQDRSAANMLDRAMGFCDAEIQRLYSNLERAVQKGETKWEDNHLNNQVIHYLYARSFFPLDRVDKITAYYLDQGVQYWTKQGLYEQGLLALALHRHGRTDGAKRIVASLRERALVTEELGMYWPFDWGMYWYQLPIETQALMVEVFDEVAADAKAVEELRIWLLKNKQTNRWESTKATAQAVYALLLNGDNWLTNTQAVNVKLGKMTLKPASYEPGTGYFKETWKGTEVKSSWSTLAVDNPNSNLVWGAAYWQYFEDMDKIQSFKKTPLTIDKQLFKEVNSPTGPKLTAIADGKTLNPGDKLKVRIEIRVDRAMEFVHLKDMRASGFEPVNVLSGYRWQDGLGYYESTKDLATHFFIDYLPRGTFVFEYPLVVNHRGDFSNGVTTLQCMYAPEFTSHSEGIRVQVVGQN